MTERLCIYCNQPLGSDLGIDISMGPDWGEAPMMVHVACDSACEATMAVEDIDESGTTNPNP
jgi:hypothetical protein